MNTQFIGKLISGTRTQGTSANGDWTKLDALFEEAFSNYPQKYVVSFWKDKCDLLKGRKIGDKMVVHCDIRSREYNGKYYYDISAWKIDDYVEDEKIKQNKVTEFIEKLDLKPVSPAQVIQQSNIDYDDLPF